MRKKNSLHHTLPKAVVHPLLLESDMHLHPFLSPDGSMAFFNSTESGELQAYMATGF
jgi:hypothetical protein